VEVTTAVEAAVCVVEILCTHYETGKVRPIEIIPEKVVGGKE
jgi:hypothetical protein